MKFITVLFAFLALSNADMYLQNPRGSNDRLNEANTDRNNANRLYDSQNNAQGGYCYGPAMSFYEGSQLSIEWTNQHGCGLNGKLVCNIVLQYMCTNSDADPTVLLRDGETTNTITDNAAGPTATGTDGGLLYGMHESLTYYTACATRTRNMGLWLADQQLGGNTAIYTRQNTNGARYGFECPEEKDYYPYWAPSPWVDVAVLAENPSTDCPFYQANSFNVMGRAICVDGNGNQAAPNNQGDCATANLQWTQVASLGQPAPDCIQAPLTRDNHLGNAADGDHNAYYNWTLPTQSNQNCITNDNCNCALRIRYNITTGDMGSVSPSVGFIDYNSNGQSSPITQDPTLEASGANMTLAVDTTQFGRTFEDRSYMFHIRPRPSGVTSTNRIFNLNVRGKRGNIVQTYPATEYDFVPNDFEGRVGDYIHFQWTGCDTNPAGNAGEGTDQTDRSNMVQIVDLSMSTPATEAWLSSNTPLFDTPQLRLHMSMLDQTNCLTMAQLLAKNNNNVAAVDADVQNCMVLNAASQYFDGGLIRMNTTGTFYYMNTRNNNFSNRGQKGVLAIVPLLPTWALAIVLIGAGLFVLSGGAAGLMLYAKSHPHSAIAETFAKI